MIKNVWSTKQKRCYQRIMSGISLNLADGKTIRFLTLTTSINAIRDIQTDFRVLKMRIKRQFGYFEYIKIRTNEGNGVLHILYSGCFLSQKWLSLNWNDIHQSPIVDIRATAKMKGLGRYIVSQYLSSQRCSFIRYSWSWGWVYRGFAGYWKIICQCKKNPVKSWNLHLSGRIIKLEGKYLKPPPDVRFMTYTQHTIDLTPIDAPFSHRITGSEKIKHLSVCCVCREEKPNIHDFNGEKVCKSCYNDY